MRLGYSMLVIVLMVLFYPPQTAAMIICMTFSCLKGFLYRWSHYKPISFPVANIRSLGSHQNSKSYATPLAAVSLAWTMSQIDWAVVSDKETGALENGSMTITLLKAVIHPLSLLKRVRSGPTPNRYRFAHYEVNFLNCALPDCHPSCSGDGVLHLLAGIET